MAATRIVMADDMRGADGAQPLCVGERRRGFVRVEAEAEAGRRALLCADPDADGCLSRACGPAARPLRSSVTD